MCSGTLVNLSEWIANYNDALQRAPQIPGELVVEVGFRSLRESPEGLDQSSEAGAALEIVVPNKL